jgi:hypothetical protein
LKLFKKLRNEPRSIRGTTIPPSLCGSRREQLKTNDQLTTLVSLQQTAQSTQALTSWQDRRGRRSTPP